MSRATADAAPWTPQPTLKRSDVSDLASLTRFLVALAARLGLESVASLRRMPGPTHADLERGEPRLAAPVLKDHACIWRSAIGDTAEIMPASTASRMS